MKQVWSSSVQLASLPISYVRSTPPSVKEAGHEMSLSYANAASPVPSTFVVVVRVVVPA